MYGPDDAETLDTNSKNVLENKELLKIIETVKSIQYGSVMIVIQDGKIVQIEKNEKMRLK